MTHIDKMTHTEIRMESKFLFWIEILEIFKIHVIDHLMNAFDLEPHPFTIKNQMTDGISANQKDSPHHLETEKEKNQKNQEIRQGQDPDLALQSGMTHRIQSALDLASRGIKFSNGEEYYTD